METEKLRKKRVVRACRFPSCDKPMAGNWTLCPEHSNARLSISLFRLVEKEIERLKIEGHWPHTEEKK